MARNVTLLDSINEELYPKFVQYLVFAVLGSIEYFVMTFVVSTAATVAGIPVTANFVALSAALLVGATILAGGMPTDN